MRELEMRLYKGRDCVHLQVKIPGEPRWWYLLRISDITGVVTREESIPQRIGILLDDKSRVIIE